MQKLVLLSAITCLLCACSLKEEACDPTGARYFKMRREGTPLTEKDKACLDAALIKGAEEAMKEANAELKKQRAQWDQAIKKQEAGGK